MRNILKFISRLIAIILVSPLILLSKLGMVFKSEMLFVGCSQLLSLVPDYVGSYLRVAFYTHTLKKCSFTGHIRFGSFFSRPEATMGHHFEIGANTIVGLIDAGRHVIIANNVTILSGAHQHNFTDPSKAMLEVEDTYVPVKIGDHVFIGDRSVVMADVGDYSIIGAGSVVVKEVPPYSVAVGNPARVVKRRDETET